MKTRRPLLFILNSLSPDPYLTDGSKPSAPSGRFCRVAGGPVSPWEHLSFTVVHTLMAGLLRWLSLPGLYQLGRFFGTLEWLVDYRRRRRFSRAWERTVGRRPEPRERRRASREFFVRARCDKLFYLIFDCIPRDLARSLFSIGNRALLDEALAAGRGAYVALSHHGPHHIAAMFLALLGYKTAGVRDRHEGGLRRYVQRRFDQLHPEFQRLRVLYADGYPRDVYRCLRDGFVVGSAMDVSRVRDRNQKAEEVTIFGEKRAFLSGPLRVAIRCRPRPAGLHRTGERIPLSP